VAPGLGLGEVHGDAGFPAGERLGGRRRVFALGGSPVQAELQSTRNFESAVVTLELKFIKSSESLVSKFAFQIQLVLLQLGEAVAPAATRREGRRDHRVGGLQRGG
jgi:hypothetical protein